MAFSAMVLRTVPIPNNVNECIKVEGVVTKIVDAGTFDIKFKLEGDDVVYYINRGQERGLVISELEDQLIGKKVTFYYPDYWTLMDPNNRTKHLNQVNFKDEILFTELGIRK